MCYLDEYAFKGSTDLLHGFWKKDFGAYLLKIIQSVGLEQREEPLGSAELEAQTAGRTELKTNL